MRTPTQPGTRARVVQSLIAADWGIPEELIPKLSGKRKTVAFRPQFKPKDLKLQLKVIENCHIVLFAAPFVLIRPFVYDV